VRNDESIRIHNQQFGTNLHGQAWLVRMHARDPAHYAPANLPSTTSHCLRSDGNPVYRTTQGRPIPACGLIRWHQRGLDFRSNELASWFVTHAAKVGLQFVAPYKTGSELHHVVGVTSPVAVLMSRNVIVKR
jgi:hypothetical protein